MSRSSRSRRPKPPQRTTVPRDPGSERVKIIPVDPAQPEYARQEVRQLLSDLEGTLFQFGGKAQITVERQVVGYVQLGDRQEPVAETVAYMLRFQTASPLSRPADPPATPPTEEAAAAPAAHRPAASPPEPQEFTFESSPTDDVGPLSDEDEGEELIDLSSLTPEQLRELGVTAEEIEEMALAGG